MEAVKFVYLVNYRPISSCTVPQKDWLYEERVELGVCPEGRRIARHGTVSYSRPLTEDEIRSYELTFWSGDGSTDRERVRAMMKNGVYGESQHVVYVHSMMGEHSVNFAFDDTGRFDSVRAKEAR